MGCFEIALPYYSIGGRGRKDGDLPFSFWRNYGTIEHNNIGMMKEASCHGKDDPYSLRAFGMYFAAGERSGPGGGKGRMQEYLSRMAGPGNVLRIVMYSDSADSVVSSVLSSDDLVGIVPMYAIYRQLADRKLVSLPVAGMSGDAAVYMEASSRFASSSLYRYVRQRISGFLELHGRM